MPLQYLPAGDPESVITSTVACGYALYELDGTEVVDFSSLVHALLRDLPMGDAAAHAGGGPAWLRPASWSAVADFLWQGLLADPLQRSVVVWRRALALRQSDPLVFQEAIGMLDDLISLGHRDVAGPCAERLRVYVDL